MPIRKFRSVEEMPPLPSRAPLDPGNLRLALSLSRTCLKLHPQHLVPGVHKRRSALAEADVPPATGGPDSK